MPQKELQKLLNEAGVSVDDTLDCSIKPSKKYPEFLLVSTTDFFYPLVEDPYLQGRIACANVLSDMYALGITEIDSMLMILASSKNMSKKERDIVTQQMIKGFMDQAKDAGTTISGGQTVMNPWPIIGGVAKSICKEGDIIKPDEAQIGDVVLLTKPLGTQVAVNLKEWMRDEKQWNLVDEIITKGEAERAYQFAQHQMNRLNKNAAFLMHKYNAHCSTDVTGFGILGHAENLMMHQKQNVSMKIDCLPCIRSMRDVDASVSNLFKLKEGYSAETSGGLLICISKDNFKAFASELEKLDGCPCWKIGEIVDGNKNAFISSTCSFLEI